MLYWAVAISGVGLILLARDRMGPVVSSVVLAHVFGGILLCAVPVLALLRRRPLPSEWHGSPGLFAAVAGALGMLLVGLALAGSSTGRETTYWAHVLLGTAAAVIVLVGAFHSGRVVKPPSKVAQAVALLLISTGALAAAPFGAQSYFRYITATSASQADSPLFPSNTRVVDAHSQAWSDSTRCGDSGCHPQAAADWARSAHAQAATPVAPTKIGSWCQGCHDPLQGLTASKQSSGVDCLACHAMTSVPDMAGNGRASFSAPETYPLANSKNATERFVGRFLISLRPQPHRSSLRTLTTAGRSTVCAPCHQMTINIPQNAYKSVRYDTLWTDWLASPYSGASAHYSAPVAGAKDCVSCHMPPKANPHACSGTSDQKANSGMQVEVFALRRASAAGIEHLDAPLAGRPVVVSPGEEVAVDVVVHNRSMGHSFPPGGPLRLARLTLQALSTVGPVVAYERQSDEHIYGMVGLDRSGKDVHYDDPSGLAFAPISNLIPAGSADTVTFRFMVPNLPGESLSIRAQLHLDPKPSLKEVRYLALASHQVRIRIAGAGTPTGPTPMRADDSRDAERFRLYGVGLLSSGHSARARRVLRLALSLAPHSVDTMVDLGRTSLAEGDLLAARRQFESANKAAPTSSAPRAWLGHTLRRMGQYARALEVLEPLAAKFGRDAELWFDIGRCRMTLGKQQSAIDAFLRMAEIDPNDSRAHFSLMQSYRLLGRVSEARREEAVYRVLKPEPPSERVIGRFWRERPSLRNEAAPRHEHALVTR